MPSSARSDDRTAAIVPPVPQPAGHRAARRGARALESGRARDGGQAAVELALCLPVVMFVLLGVVQVAIVVRNELVVQHAAREAARAAAVSAAPAAAAARAAAPFGSHGIDGLSVGTSTAATTVRVVVRARTSTDVPLVGAFVGDVAHEAVAVMVLEPP